MCMYDIIVHVHNIVLSLAYHCYRSVVYCRIFLEYPVPFRHSHLQTHTHTQLDKKGVEWREKNKCNNNIHHTPLHTYVHVHDSCTLSDSRGVILRRGICSVIL